MFAYRAHYLAHSGELYGVEHFDAENDAAAIEYANKQLRSPWGRGHEIWHEDRLVHREIYS
jgi:hypothetical protein